MPLVVGAYLASREAPIDTPDYNRYVQLIHYAEGSAIFPMLLKLYLDRLGEAVAPLRPRIVSETANHLGYLKAELEDRDFFVGKALTGADVLPSFVAQIVVRNGAPGLSPKLIRVVNTVEVRPTYQLAVGCSGA